MFSVSYKGLASFLSQPMQWIFSNPEYMEWKNWHSSFLYINGGPGTGKSLLTSIILDNLKDEHDRHSSSIFCYIFCDYKNKDTLTAVNILACIFEQVLTSTFAQGILPAEIEDLSWVLRTEPGSSLDVFMDNCSRCLLSLCSSKSHLIITLDGIDECDHREIEILQTVFRETLVNRNSNGLSVNILLTGRSRGVQLKNAYGIKFYEIEITQDLMEHDITAYIDYRFNSQPDIVPKCMLTTGKSREAIIDYLVRKSEGMILWVAHQIDELSQGEYIKEGTYDFIPLERLFPPTLKGLSDVFQRNFSTIRKELRPVFEIVLKWVLFGVRPLSIGEFCEVIRLYMDYGFLTLDIEDSSNVYVEVLITQVLGTANGILKLADDNTILLTHSSIGDHIREHGLSYSETLVDGASNRLNALDCHDDIAQICFRHIMRDFDEEASKVARADASISMQDFLEIHPLYSYACCYGYFHVIETLRTSESDTVMRGQRYSFELLSVQQDTNFSVFLDVLRTETEDAFNLSIGRWLPYFTYTQAATAIGMGLLKYDLFRRFFPEVAYRGSAALVDLNQNIELDRSNDRAKPLGPMFGLRLDAELSDSDDERGSMSSTESKKRALDKLLLMAIDEGSSNFQHGFLQMGADASTIVNDEVGSILNYAIRYADCDFVEALLRKGAGLNQISGEFGTPLQTALMVNKMDVFDLLLGFSPEIDTYGGSYGGIVNTAAKLSNTYAVKKLLGTGVQLDLDADHGFGSALQLACDPIDEMMDDSDSEGSVSGASRSELSFQSFDDESYMLDERELLQRIDARDGYWEEVCRLSTETVEMLIAYGADPNLDAKEGLETPLQACVRHKNIEAARVLLKSGADPNLRDRADRYGLPLTIAVLLNDIDMVLLLLESDADINKPCPKTGTCLHAAIGKTSRKDLIELLIQYGADVCAEIPYYGSVLNLAALCGRDDIVSLLISSGARVNVVAGRYGTPLEAAAYCGSAEVVQTLLSQGADPNILGGIYGSPIQAACFSVRTRLDLMVIKLLVQADANVEIENGKYGNVLQAAALSGSYDLLRFLLSYLPTATINHLLYQISGQFGTVVQAACFASFLVDHDTIEILDLLLHVGGRRQIDILGGEYGSALQAACWAQNLPVVEFLLKNRADPNGGEGLYGSPYDIAKRLKLTDIMNVLIKHGARVTAEDYLGETISLLDDAIEALSI
ncbi:ankyrin repeat-containing domain protein [Dipodascopsis tothii]|uniref:ankyrin repeat-containing domain protein n=1 Tax=Dipodascopsis tothii TaxID=44089 RepID=UPI0034CE0374